MAQLPACSCFFLWRSNVSWAAAAAALCQGVWTGAHAQILSARTDYPPRTFFKMEGRRGKKVQIRSVCKVGMMLFSIVLLHVATMYVSLCFASSSDLSALTDVSSSPPPLLSFSPPLLLFCFPSPPSVSHLSLVIIIIIIIVIITILILLR